MSLLSSGHAKRSVHLGLMLIALTGCDKLKSAIGKDDGGASASAQEAGTGAGAEASKGTGLLSFFGSDFEGEIAMNLTSRSTTKAGPQQLVFGIKKPKYRVDISAARGSTNPSLAQGGTLLIDLPTKTGHMLIHPQKMAMVIDFEKMKNMPTYPGAPAGPKGTPGVPTQPPKIEKTGKQETIAGYACEIWNVTTDKQKAQICAADGIAWIDLGDLGMSSPEMTIAAVASGANRFPLRLISYDPAGIEEMRMEATKIEKKKLDDARFVVPPDYRVVDMSAMMGGLGGVPGAGTLSPPPRTKTR